MSLLLWLACSGAPDAPDAPVARTLTVAAYTTPREALSEAVFPAFARAWQEKTGEAVSFEASYQASGAQARAVVEGFEADLVILSLAPDVDKIADAGLITRDWRAGPTQGMMSRSLVVVAVRPGNPKKILDWSDLTRPDVEVLTPNVRTSGGAMWNVSAIWGAASRGRVAGHTPETLLSGVLARVNVMDKGARESIVSFEKGVGDAAITYENEVLVARKAGQNLDYVIPSSTILIENPIAVVDSYAQKHGNQDLAEAFLTFALGAEAQAAFAEYGLRPVVGESALPQPADLFTIADLGGWSAVKKTVFAEGAGYDQALTRAQEP